VTGVTRVSRGARPHKGRKRDRDTKNSKASCQQAAAARRARDAAVRALPIACVAERLEAGEHAAERAALCARAGEARAVCRGTRRRAPRCAALRASARTRVYRVRVRVCAHERVLLLRGLGSCAAPCAQRVRVRVSFRVLSAEG